MARKIQAQGIHHITLTGADRQTSIDFWEGLLGFSLIFDQPNLDDHSQGICISQLATVRRSPSLRTKSVNPRAKTSRIRLARCTTSRFLSPAPF